MFEGLFEGTRVFLTGHTGFKGSWLSLWLSELGAKVHGYSLPAPTEPSHFEAASVVEVLQGHTLADIREKSTLKEALKVAQPDVVFHLAAQSLVRESYETPYETFDVNVMGSASLLDCIRELRLRCVVVVITSDKCYQNVDQVWGYRECDRLGGHDPYSASKAATEILVSSYRQSFFPIDELDAHGVQLATARSGNVIGGGDWANDRLLADCARCVSNGEAVPVRSPQSVRPWQHVLEPLCGYLTLAAKMLESSDPLWCEGWNFGPFSGEEITVGELVERFCAEWEHAEWKDVSQGEHPHEARFLKLSVDKAIWNLGWRPRWGIDEAVRRTAEWYKSFYAKRSNARELSRRDIASYLQS